jgi:hypothetical protein
MESVDSLYLLCCVRRVKKVVPFVTSMGDKMDYRVALDDAGSAQAYMDRYNVGVRNVVNARWGHLARV